MLNSLMSLKVMGRSTTPEDGVKTIMTLPCVNVLLANTHMYVYIIYMYIYIYSFLNHSFKQIFGLYVIILNIYVHSKHLNNFNFFRINNTCSHKHFAFQNFGAL